MTASVLVEVTIAFPRPRGKEQRTGYGESGTAPSSDGVGLLNAKYGTAGRSPTFQFVMKRGRNRLTIADETKLVAWPSLHW